MSAIVPDTLQGALIVSVIDFFLSFLIISGIGVVLAMFPLLNRAALVFKRGAPAGRAHGGKPAPGKASAQESKPAPPSAGDIAAIAAAVFAVMDGAPHRIINIEPSPRRSSWVAEGRIAQHGSHTPVR
jgi:hypothetical protein